MKRSEIYYMVARLLEEAERQEAKEYGEEPIEGEFTELPAQRIPADLYSNLQYATHAGEPDIEAEQDAEELEPPQLQPQAPVLKRISIYPFILAAMVALLISATISASFFFLLPHRVSVTLYPSVTPFSTSRTFTRQDIAIIPISTVLTATKTVTATGYSTRPATAARGVITFYNASTTAQMIAAGTILTASNGISIITDVTKTIAAAQPPTEGSAAIPAHSMTTGAAGNIPADAISGTCCNRLTLFAYNLQFTGGAAAIRYRVISPSDIATAAADLKSGLDKTERGQLLQKISPDDTLLPERCTTETTSSRPAGAEGEQTIVTERETCITAAYNTRQLESAGSDYLIAQARQALGTRYTPAGAIETSAASIDTNPLKITLTISGLFAYQLTDQQQQALKRQLAGKSRAEADIILFQMKGVTRAQIDSNTATLPDASRIDLRVAYI